MNRRRALTSLLVLGMGAGLSACVAPAAPAAPAAPPKAETPAATDANTAEATAPSATTAPEATAAPIEATEATQATQPFSPIDPFEQIKQLGRGVNFGNALEAPTEGEWGMTLEEGFFDLVKEGGFNTIRLPTKWSGHASREAPFTIDADFFARVDWAVDNALKRGLNIVVNMHHYDEIFIDPKAENARFMALWDQIATRYKDRPAQVVLEPLNEPNGALTSPVWQKVFEDALAVIRKTNPTRNVVFTGANWGGVSDLKNMKRPDDPHLIATFHYYLPFAFTHQGADWVDGSDAWLGREWKGDSGDRVSIDFDLDNVAAWAKDNNIPLWMGEFGSYSKADMASRQRWTTYLARAAEKRGIAWAYWEFGAGFGVYDRTKKEWVEPILTSLVPK